jgi:hypothetical protein
MPSGGARDPIPQAAGSRSDVGLAGEVGGADARTFGGYQHMITRDRPRVGRPKPGGER